MTVIESVKSILQNAEQDAFGLHEQGGTPEECRDVIENAWQKVYQELGVVHVCYGCGFLVTDCKCNEHYEQAWDVTP